MDLTGSYFPEYLSIPGMIKRGFLMQWENRSLRFVTLVIVIVELLITLLSYVLTQLFEPSQSMVYVFAFIRYAVNPIFYALIIQAMGEIITSSTTTNASLLKSSAHWVKFLFILNLPMIWWECMIALAAIWLEAITKLSQVGANNMSAILLGVNCCLIFPLSIVFIVLTPTLDFGARAMVYESKSIMQSYRRGWSIFKRNIWETIVLYLLISIAVCGPLIIFGLPFICSWNVSPGQRSSLLSLDSWVTLMVNLIAYGYVGISIAFQGIVLTIAFLFFRKKVADTVIDNNVTELIEE